MLSYGLPDDVKADALYQRLHDRHKVGVKVVPTNWFNGQRISTHIFSTEDDVNALVRGLRAELS